MADGKWQTMARPRATEKIRITIKIKIKKRIIHDSLCLLQVDNFLTAILAQADIDVFGTGGGNIFANEIGFNGEFAVAAINKHGQLNAAGTAEIVECIHGSPSRAPAVEHVINEDHGLAADIEWNDRWVNIWRRLLPEIIAMHADIQFPHRNTVAPNAFQEFTEPLRQNDASALHADEHNGLAVVVPLSDFVRDASEHAVDGRGV